MVMDARNEVMDKARIFLQEMLSLVGETHTGRMKIILPTHPLEGKA